MDRTAYLGITEMLPQPISSILGTLPPEVAEYATEIRFRAGRPCAIHCGGSIFFVNGEDGPVVFDQHTIRTIAAHLCGYSLYNRENELKNGFVTLRGGHRMGVCSTLLCDGTVDISSIGSLCIRIAREHRGCAATVFGQTMMEFIGSVLITGPPLSGKTTILRDLARILSSRPLYRKVTLIDERGELAGTWCGQPTLDIGTCCDVLDGYTRTLGFDIAVRTLSPEIIICDEIGSIDDIASLSFAAHSGCQVIASAHADNLEDLMGKKAIQDCIEGGIFDYVVVLDSWPTIGSVKKVYQVKSL